MKTTVKERIKIFLTYLSIGQNALELKVGWSRGYINNTKHISADKLLNLINEYPRLNIEWLLTGEGEMIKEPFPSENVKITTENEFLVKRFEEIVLEKKELQNILEEKEKINEQLIAQIKQLEFESGYITRNFVASEQEKFLTNKEQEDDNT